MNRRPLAIVAALLLPGAGAADWDGGIALTARTVDVDGDRDRYRHHINLDGGLRLDELVLERRNGERGPDVLRVEAYGLGDPQRRMGLRVREADRYRFDYERRRSEFIYADPLFDEAVHDAEAAGPRLDLRRVTDDATLAVELGRRAELELGFQRYEREGEARTLLDVDREEFQMAAPVDQRQRSGSATFRYRWDRASLAFTERYREFDDDALLRLPAPSDGSDPAAPTALEAFRLTQPVSHDSHEHALVLRLRPVARTEVSLDLMRADLDGDHQARETATGTSFTGAPIDRDDVASGDLDRRTDLVELSVRQGMTDAVSAVATLRHYQLDQSGELTQADSGTWTDWRLDNTAVELGLEAALTEQLTAAAGWIGEWRDQRYRTNAGDVFDDDTEHEGHYAELRWRPLAGLSLTLEGEDASIHDPFSLTAATDRRFWRLTGRYRVSERWSVSGSHQRTRRSNDGSDWEAEDQRTSLRADYTAGRLSAGAGASRIEVDREVDVAVSNRLRTVVFDVDYNSDAWVVDASANWRITPRWSVGTRMLRYRNDGSFDVDRDDVTVRVRFSPTPEWGIGLSWRYVDYDEAELTAYDARLTELTLERGF